MLSHWAPMASKMASRQRYSGRYYVYLVRAVWSVGPVNILRMVKQHIKINGWIEKPVRLGPATCGQPIEGYKSECRVVHAYAEMVGRPTMFGDTAWAFIYDRPCNAHESAWGREQRKKVGLSG